MNLLGSMDSPNCGFTSWVLAVLLLIVSGPTALAQGQETDDPSPHSEATLVSEVTSITPGEAFTVALRLEMDEGWHSYWINPGDSGQPTSIEWSLPEGFEADSIQWPFPHRIELGSLTSYGYSDEVFLLTTITPPDTLTPGQTVSLGGRAEWLICEEICLQAHADIERSLPVVRSGGEESQWASAIESSRSKQPQSLEDWTVEAAQSSGSYTLAVTPPEGHRPDLEGAYFFPTEKSVLDHAAPQPVAQQEGIYFIALQQSPYAQKPTEQLRGVLVAPEGASFTAEGQTRALRVDVPVDSSVSTLAEGSLPLTEEASTSEGGGLSLAWALLFAFVGGLLLNLMPCVFPVLSVKILGFARQAGEQNRTIRRHGFLFGTGVLVSMWVLAGALLALRAAGSQIGWGFQLQSPLFVALMAMLFFGIGLNLLGAFEIGTGLMNWGGRMQEAAPEEGDMGAFLTGVLATVVATPCTAPFMGAALGVALTLSATGALLIFTALGVGMATPYVALSMAPSLLERLPEPGGWMETLKQAFSFPMFATCIWLVWVFGQQTGNAGVALLLVGLLLLGMAAWIHHRWSAPSLSRSMAVATRGLVLLTVAGAIAAGVIGAGYEQPEPASASTETEEATRWHDYSSDTVEEFRAQGRPVFVDFTAAWCLTCQVNKRSVLSTESVQEAFAEHDVALVRADWTNRDPEITKALESHGRSGVPVYVLYSGDGSEPQMLPEVLTEGLVIDALDDLPASTSPS